MKKLLLLTLVCAVLISAFACASENISDETTANDMTPHETTHSETIGCGAEETTAIAYTGMDGTFYVYKNQWQDYISGIRDDYEIITQATTATTLLETTADPMSVLNELTIVPQVAVELSGERNAPFASLVCANANGGAVADGVLILQSTENVLGGWVEKGMIPTITLSARAKLVNTASDTVVTKPTDFHFYKETNGSYTKVASLENAMISDIYAYGAEHFAGESVYIRFDFSRTIEGGHATYAYIMRVDFEGGTEKADIFNYAATVKTASGEYVNPYIGTVYFQKDGRVSDGALMFYSAAELLPDWIEKGNIPLVDIDGTSTVHFTYGQNLELVYSGKFSIYIQNADGSVSKVRDFSESDLAEVYQYGKTNLVGQRAYISYSFLIRSLEDPTEDNSMICFICVDFDEEVSCAEWFPEVLFYEAASGREITPYVDLREARYAHDDAGEYMNMINCLGWSLELYLERLQNQGAVMPCLSASLSYEMTVDGKTVPFQFAVYNMERKFIGEYKNLSALPSGDYYACFDIIVNGKTFDLPHESWTEHYNWTLWFTVRA